MTYRSALDWITQNLTSAWEKNNSIRLDPRQEAQTLLSYYLKISIPEILKDKERNLTSQHLAELDEMVQRRGEGVPLQYILGESEFYGQTFKVGPGVLIPRWDSEAMIQLGLEHLKTLPNRAPRILDLGAGSGALGFSVLLNHPGATLVAIEKSDEAKEFLRENRELHQLTSRVKIVELDLDQVNEVNQWRLSQEPFDLILANPPYIDVEDEDLDFDVKSFEPPMALFAGSQGLEKIFSWSQSFLNLVSSKGIFLCEMGWKQGPSVSKWSKAYTSDFEFKIHQDLSGKERFFSFRQR